MTNSEYRDPSREYPPSRPTLKMFLFAILVVAAGVLIVNWPQVSAAAHVSQIESEIEHVVGL